MIPEEEQAIAISVIVGILVLGMVLVCGSDDKAATSDSMPPSQTDGQSPAPPEVDASTGEAGDGYATSPLGNGGYQGSGNRIPMRRSWSNLHGAVVRITQWSSGLLAFVFGSYAGSKTASFIHYGWTSSNRPEQLATAWVLTGIPLAIWGLLCWLGRRQ